MYWLEIDQGYVIRLEKDEKVMETLSRFVAERRIGSGWLSGLGAFKNTRLGFYHLAHRRYDERLLQDEMELVSLVGNVAWHEGKPALHCHVTLGDTDFRAHAGHLFEAEVAVTVEVRLWASPVTVQRRFDDAVGLNLLCLGPA